MSVPNKDWVELPGGHKSVRPRLQIERTKIENICEAIAAVMVVSLILHLTLNWSSLPARIPIHFNHSGQADGWGDKRTFLIIWGITVVMYVGLSILQCFPHIYNYPFNLNARNVHRQYLLARQLLTIVKFLVVGSFSFISWQTIQVAKGNAEGIQSWFFLILIPAILGVIVVYFIKAKRAI
jgi:uncharacterized membrane protein